jgi:dTDP-glucose 4,6-dehydratase
VLVTGGAGFIGSNFVRYALSTHPDWHVHDARQADVRRAPRNLHDVIDNPRHTFVQGDICDAAVDAPLVENADIVVHFAAETHVDRSILAAGDFIQTDVEGTFVSARGARRAMRGCAVRADLDRRGLRQRAEGSSVRDRRTAARNPYSASKPAPIAWHTAIGHLRSPGRSSRERRTTTGRISSRRRSSHSSSRT